MIFQTALQAHIDQQYAEYLGYEYPAKKIDLAEYVDPEYSGETFIIPREVGGRVAKEMGELVSFGIFDNCRETGITVTTAGGWQFCVYEHRNSNDICIEGCPLDEVEPYGPYGGVDKFDTLHQSRWQDYESAANAMIAMIKRSVEGLVTRADLKTAAKAVNA